MKMRFFNILFIALAISTPLSAEMLLFGGIGHKEFLGCFDCGKYASGSICNKYGQHGSKYSSESIWNKYGNFGSKYNSSSPWNKYSSSSDIPVLVDRGGGFHGYFSINSYRDDAVKFSRTLKQIYEENDEDLDVVQEKLCNLIN